MKATVEIGKKVTGKNGSGVIERIITRSTGYVEVRYDDGIIKKEMAFNLKDENGIELKNAPKSETSGMTAGEKKRYKDAKAIAAFDALSNLEKIKSGIMRVNGLVEGDRRSMGYQLFEEFLARITNEAKDMNNTFILNVAKSVDKWMKASEKQAYVLAKFADESGLTYDELTK